MATIQLLMTGNELMAGHTIDSNSATLAEYLSEHGYSIYKKTTVGDDIQLLCQEIERLSAHSDVLIINGGLGPTIDDLTAQALADVTGKAIVENPIALAHVKQWCERLKLPVSDENRKQAMLPETVDIIDNPVGTAVGFSIEHNHCLILCTPGVPRELKLMLEQSIITMITTRHPLNNKPNTVRLQTFGLGESSLQRIVNDNLTDWPQAIELGFRAGYPLLEIKLTVQQEQHLNLQNQWLEKIRRLIGDYIVGDGATTMAESVVELLKQRQQTITTAESCTGGLIASHITEVAGASAVFEAGFVTYSNAIKQQLLSVEENILQQHGAVSEPIVLQMAQQAINISHADYAIAVSGVAGPDGGTEKNPVGTVWIAWGHRNNLKTQCLRLKASRKRFQQMVSAISLDLTRREILKLSDTPDYLKRYQTQ